MKKCSLIAEILKSCGHNDLYEILVNSNMDQGHYALSWILTWFAHVIDQDCHSDDPEHSSIDSGTYQFNKINILIR